MKTIDTLVDDIYQVLEDPSRGLLSDEEALGRVFAQMLAQRINPPSEGAPVKDRRGEIYLSNYGIDCDRLLWYKANKPEIGKPLLPFAKLKFIYGDLLELLLIELARKAGHTVTGPQFQVKVSNTRGRIDIVIDGTLVDVKSASSPSFNKFRLGLRPETDAFGYIPQLKGYLSAIRKEDFITDKNRAAFLAIDKTTGHLHLDIHYFKDEHLDEVEPVVVEKEKLVASPELPARGFQDKEDKDGNRVLALRCSYCEFNEECWPSLTTVVEKGKPKFYTKITKRLEENVKASKIDARF